MKHLLFNWREAEATTTRYTYFDLFMIASIMALWSVMIWEVLIGTGWA